MKIVFVLSLFLPFFLNAQKEVDVQFRFVFHEDTIKENTWYVSDKGDSLKFENIRFFVSLSPMVKVLSADVQLVDWRIPESQKWPVPLNQNDELEFTLGLDPVYHTSSEMTGDLDPSLGMYWAWQSGYIQVKIEGVSPNSPTRNHKFQFHLGGYLAPFSVEKVLNLGKVDQEKVDVEFDLAKVYSTISIDKKNEIMIPGKDAMKVMKKVEQAFEMKLTP